MLPAYELGSWEQLHVMRRARTGMGTRPACCRCVSWEHVNTLGVLPVCELGTLEHAQRVAGA